MRLRAYVYTDGRCQLENPIGTSYAPVSDAENNRFIFETHMLHLSAPEGLCYETYDGNGYRRATLATDDAHHSLIRLSDAPTQQFGSPDHPLVLKLEASTSQPCSCTDHTTLRNPLCMEDGACGVSSTAVDLIRNILFMGKTIDPLRMSAAERCIAPLHGSIDRIDIADVVEYMRSVLFRRLPNTSRLC
eukprot:7390490-Prymnesium_polylepis.2